MSKNINHVAAVIAVAAVAATAIVIYTTTKANRKNLENVDNNDDDTDGKKKMIQLRQEYQLLPKAIRLELEDAITNVGRIGSRMKLTNRDKGILYGLYKQIVYGDAPRTIPKFESWNIMKESVKYSSWCQYRGLTCEIAAIQYISIVRHLESISDWEKTDNDDTIDDDDDDEDENGMSGSAVVSRPIDAIPVDINDHYDDIINGTTSIGSQLLKAASENDVNTIRSIMMQSNNDNNNSNIVNYTDPTGQTALHIAADKGCFDIIQVLIQEYNANVLLVDETGISVLQTAVVAGHYNICVWLLQNTIANPDQPDHDGDTPRSCAEDDSKLYEYFQSIPIHA